MNIDDIIRKLRKMKRFEINFRGLDGRKDAELVWDKFFSTKGEYDLTVKYCINILKNMNHERRKEVFEEYYFHIYFKYYQENGITLDNLYNPELLSVLGLSYGADIKDIKKRFRELAKKYHPDHGGDHNKMIELLEVYNKLTDTK